MTSQSLASSQMATMRSPSDVGSRSRLQREAPLVRSRGSAGLRADFAFVVNRDVLRQPVEYVGPMPAHRLSTVRALLRESSEDRESEKQPARATGQT